MKTGVLTLIDSLHLQGAERIAVNIASNLRDSDEYTPFVCMSRQGGILEEKLNEYEIQHINIDRNYFFEVHKFKQVVNLIKENNIRIIHAHKLGSSLWACLLAAYCKLPSISHLHGHNYRQDHKLKSIVSHRVISALSTEIIVVSDSIKKSLVQNIRVPESKITTIHNAIDPAPYQLGSNLKVRKELGIEAKTKVIGLVAALTRVKNHGLYLMAAKEVLNSIADVKFLIIGEGPEEDKLKQMAFDLGINQSIIFTGFRRDVPELLSIIDVGVLSSNSEGLPLSVLEYMASSKPVVSTNVGGVTEAVRDGENGFLVPAGDYKSMGLKMKLLLENEGLALKMGMIGFNIIKQEFSEKTFMDKITELYGKVLLTEGLS